MDLNAHWLVKVARAHSVPGAETLEVAARTPTLEAWEQVLTHCATDEQALAQAIGDWFRLDVADPDTIDENAAGLLSSSIARKYNVFPMYEEDRHVVIATSDPCDVRAEQEVGFTSGRLPKFVIAGPDMLAELINNTYAPDRAVTKLLDRIGPDEDSNVTLIEQEDDRPLDDAVLTIKADDAGEDGEGPIVKLTNMILKDAVSKSASDIHIQPLPTGGVVRLRVDGVLRRGITVPLAVLARVVSRIKIMSQLDISDRMRPQDGRARIKIDGGTYDLRVSTVPVRGGEKAVIRILDPQQSRELDDVGLPEEEVARLRRVLRNRDGILVVTGPTGSGKTTTMYAALQEISSEDVNIMTVEDPVEYELPGLTQIQVDPKQSVTFQTALKAILRQDPDVIFVGEIRDTSTAQMAAQASLTGHLVLTTIHANDAVGSVRRFMDLGLDSGTISETLRGALAQRLVRTLCTDCTVPAAGRLDTDEKTLAEVFDIEPPMRAVGCDECGHSGYRGRRPVVELIVPSAELLRLVAEEAPHVALMKQARADGTRTLLESALDLVRDGLTTLVEVERVIGEEAIPMQPTEVAEGPDPAADLDVDLPVDLTVALEPVVAPSQAPATEPAPDTDPPSGPLLELPRAVPNPPEPRGSEPNVMLRSAPAGVTQDEIPGAELPLDEVQAQAPRVLIVDDDAGSRLLLSSILQHRGWSVTEALDGKEGLIAISKGEMLSLVVLDLGLPDIDGMDILQIVKRNMDTAGIPVIVLTGRTTRDAERQALLEGADDYIRKPIDPAIFLTRAQAVMKRVGET